jgi:valyl-tRNA synthetase
MKIQQDLLPIEDRWILSRLSRTIAGVTSLMEDFQFGEAQRQIHDFLWGEFCDWYIEIVKLRLRSREVPSPIPVLVYVLEASLRLLHPYMPFITEELWQNLKKHLPADWQTAESIVIAAYPEADSMAIDLPAERIVASVIEIIHSIRNARAQYKVGSTKWIEAQIYAGELTSNITPYSAIIQTLAKVRPVTFLDSRQEVSSVENALVLVLKESEVVLPMESMMNREAERKRLQKEIEQGQAEINRLESRLKDEAFLTKAPEAIVDKERDRLVVRRDKLERLKEQISRF